MLYKFKSKIASDLIMLEPNGRRLLDIIGKDSGGKGIILPEQMADAIAALQRAIEHEEAAREAAKNGQIPDATQAHPQADDHVSLRQRSAPFIDMLRQCLAAKEEVVWGV